MQSDSLGQEIAASAVVLSIDRAAQLAGVAGLVLTSTRPALSTAAQRAAEAHETERRACEESLATSLHVEAPAAGAVLANTRPSPSTATHSPREGQAIAASATDETVAGADQESGAAASAWLGEEIAAATAVRTTTAATVRSRSRVADLHARDAAHHPFATVEVPSTAPDALSAWTAT